MLLYEIQRIWRNSLVGESIALWCYQLGVLPKAQMLLHFLASLQLVSGYSRNNRIGRRLPIQYDSRTTERSGSGCEVLHKSGLRQHRYTQVLRGTVAASAGRVGPTPRLSATVRHYRDRLNNIPIASIKGQCGRSNVNPSEPAPSAMATFTGPEGADDNDTL